MHRKSITKAMTTMIEKLEKIAAEIAKVSGNTRTVTDRRIKAFENLCRREGIRYQFVGEKPHGRACTVVEMSNVYRVYVRCGYGRYNYSPCYEINK